MEKIKNKPFGILTFGFILSILIITIAGAYPNPFINNSGANSNNNTNNQSDSMSYIVVGEGASISDYNNAATILVDLNREIENKNVKAQVTIVTDKELDSLEGRNVILVGGSCVNRLTAQALGVDFPSCSSEFTSETGVGPGQFTVRNLNLANSNNNSSQRINQILLVAGYNEVDTYNAVQYLTNGSFRSTDTFYTSPASSRSISTNSSTNTNNYFNRTNTSYVYIPD